MNETSRFRMIMILTFLYWLVGISIDLSADVRDRGAPELTTVTLKDQVIVSSRKVTIGDIAEITGGIETIRKQIAAMDIDEIGSENTINIKSRHVDYRLKLSDMPERLFRIAGEKQTSVFFRALPLDRDRVIQAAITGVKKRLPWPEDEISIKLAEEIRVPLPSISNTEDVSIKAEPHSSKITVGRVQMDISIFDRGERKTAFPVFLEIRLKQQVPIARYALGKGETLSDKNTLIDIQYTDGSIRIATPESIQGKRLKKPLIVGQIIQPTDLEDDPVAITSAAVKNRQLVSMVSNLGAISITCKGEALQDGKIGDLIRVQNVDSKQIIVARVSGAGRVEIEK